MAFEEKYMIRAIELAKKGEGAVNPNPLVGAVIVKDGKIIGEGYHARYGGLHAERDAISKLTESAEGAEIYVTLEPCCHYGMQPPCVEAIVEQGIKTVYCGSDDPNEKVAGKGFEYLRQRGVEVHTHMMKEECDKLNDVFFHYITTKMPYIVMKYAMTMDGKIASKSGKSRWISNETSRLEVQKMRNKYTGIMVGIGTVLADNPTLNCRLENGRNPIRIIVDSNLRIPMDSNLVKTAGEIRTIVAGSENGINSNIEKKERLEKAGLQIMYAGVNKVDLKIMLEKLGELGIDGILLEGGGTLNESFLSAGLVSQIEVFLAPKVLGGISAPGPVGGEGFDSPEDGPHFSLTQIRNIENDIWATYKNN